jgi:anthranilate synthase component 1
MDGRYHPNYEEFTVLANHGNLIPVYREILADLETPVSALSKLDRGDSAFLLESVEGGETLGRNSFLGVDPRLIITVQNDTITTIDGQQVRSHPLGGSDPLKELERIMSPYKSVDIPNLPPFTGGLVGYLGYDMVNYFENLPKMGNDTLEAPDALFFLVDTLLLFEHASHTIKIVANAYVQDSIKDAYKEAQTRIDATIGALQRPHSMLRFGSGRKPPIDFKSNRSKEDYCEAVKKCKEYIAAGDIFQVVISQRLDMEIESPPFDIYRSLRTINPSPYMFYLKYKDLHIAGSSPELLVKKVGRNVTYRPIAGTRPRGKNVTEDDALKMELLNDSKECAEHIMLVDLGRNDIGRVCKYHTVKVPENKLKYIEKYSHVMHIVSEITGELRDDKKAFDLLRACFPAGTLTGAPKIRAMEIIAEQEPTKRGPYGGAIGYIGFSGNMDTGIIIRTVTIKKQKAMIQAGAGIVADSDPEKEYQECCNKARGMLGAIELAETYQHSLK